MAPRVEKTEVFRKCWNFANRTYCSSCIMRKHVLLWTKQTVFFPYFYRGIICYSADLFDCALNFKFYSKIFIFLTQIKYKGEIFELRSSHLFWDQLFKEILEVKYQACNFTGPQSFTSVFEDFGHLFLTCFLQNFS